MYLNDIYNFPNNPFILNLELGYENYTVKPNNGSNIPLDGRSLSFMPIADYRFWENKFVVFCASLRTGISFDNIDVGVFNEGYELRFVVAP